MHSPHPHKVRYPYLYAESVVDSFIDSWGRVTIFVAKKSGMTPSAFRNLLVKTFMYRNGRWNVTRDLLKYIDRHNLYNEMAFYDRSDFQKYLTCVKSLVEDDLIDSEKLQKRG
jgi:hypothetical protein